MGSGQSERAGILQQLVGLANEAHHAPDRDALKSIFYRAQTIGAQYPSDPEIQAAVEQLKHAVLEHGKRLQQPVAAGSGAGYAPSPPGPLPVPTPDELKVPPVVEPQPKTPPPFRAQAAGGGYRPPSAPKSRQPGLDWKKPVLTGAGIAVALFGLVLLLLRGHKDQQVTPPPNPATMGVVEVHTTPPGATILVNGAPKGRSNGRIDLPAGQYDVQATLNGYEPAVRSIGLAPGGTVSLDMPLRPAGDSVRIVADMESGTVSLDGKASEMQGDQAAFDKVAPGTHTVKVSGRAGEASFQFNAPAGALPQLTAPPSVRNFLAIIVSNLGNQARIDTNADKPTKVSIDGNAVGMTSPHGLTLDNVTAGDHELTWGEGESARKLIVRFGPVPSLNAFFKLDINGGTLVVLTGEDKATVTLNGRTLPRTTSRGQLRIPGLPAGEYTVRVAKDGFLAAPDQKAQIRKGEEAKLQFKLEAMPQMAVLRIQGATMGAAVFLDRERVGEVQSDGSFSYANIHPGEHMVELRREGYAAKRLSRTFQAGKTVDVGGADAILEQAQGTVQVSVTPSDAKVLYHRTGETEFLTLSGSAITLPEGSYRFLARAPNHGERSTQVAVTAGKTVTVTLDLPAERIAPKAPTAMGMNGFPDLTSWGKEDGEYVHKGGNFVMYSPTNTAGTFTFTATLKSKAILHARALQWVLHYTDSRDYILCQLEKKMFTRKYVTNGKSAAPLPQKVDVGDLDEVTVQIEVQAHRISMRAKDGDRWVPLDTWNDPREDLSQGKFGFYIQGQDEVRISHFTFQPAQ